MRRLALKIGRLSLLASLGVSSVLVAARVAAETQPRPSERQAIEAAANTFAEAWNRHDMNAFAELFAPDANFVNVIGLHWKGRAEIKTAHQELHATRMKDSRLTIENASSRFLRPDVGLVHATWTLVGDTGLGSAAQPPRHGVLSLVLTKEGGRWLIAAAQNTDIVPIPNVPTK